MERRRERAAGDPIGDARARGVEGGREEGQAWRRGGGGGGREEGEGEEIK